MGFSKIISSISVFVTGLLPASCHHHAAPGIPVPAAATNAMATTNSNPNDLGVITLTNHVECRFQLGNGKDCILTPKLEDKKNSTIVVTFETRTDAGKIQGMSVAQVDSKNGNPVEVSVGDFQVSFTPNVVDE